MSHSLLKLIGNTPLIRLHGMETADSAAIWGKLESANPGGSVKDRIALGMIIDAEQRGLLGAGARLIEPTSGNTGIGLALVCAVKGYSITLVMPDSMSLERRRLLQAYGAQLILTAGSDGMRGAIDTAQRLAVRDGCYLIQQFTNPANPATHEATTAPEIFAARAGQIDAFVTAVGTGGTITGVGRYLRQRLPQVQIVAVEPQSSAVLSGGNAGAHAIQGIGAGFVPEVLDTSVYHEVLTVSDADAIQTSVQLARMGIVCGISSGANVWASQQLARRLGRGKHVVTTLCDSGERYLSTGIFDA